MAVTVLRIMLHLALLAAVAYLTRYHLLPYIKEMRLRTKAAVEVTTYTRSQPNPKASAVICSDADATIWLDPHGNPIGHTAPTHPTVALGAGLWGRLPDAADLRGAAITITAPAVPQRGDVARIDVSWADGKKHRLFAPARVP